MKYSIDKDVELKLLEMEYAEELFALIDSSRTYLRKWLPWVDYYKSIEDIKDYIKLSEEDMRSKRGLHVSVWYKNNIAGVINYHSIQWIDRAVALGYWLGEEYQGLGIMTKACRTMIGLAFNAMGFNRVEIRCAVDNNNSRAIPERLGFTMEGIIRDGQWLVDHYVDLAVYGILKKEWKKK